MDQSDSDEGNVSSSETGVSSCVVDSGDRDIVVKRTSVRKLAAKNSSSQSSSSIEEEDGVVSIDSVEEKESNDSDAVSIGGIEEDLNYSIIRYCNYEPGLSTDEDQEKESNDSDTISSSDTEEDLNYSMNRYRNDEPQNLDDENCEDFSGEGDTASSQSSNSDLGDTDTGGFDFFWY